MKIRRILRWAPSLALLLPGVALLILAVIGNGDISKVIKEYKQEQRLKAILVEHEAQERMHPNPSWTELDRYFANQASSPASSPTPAK